MSGVIDNKFIFSNAPGYRIRRHLLFWFCIWVQFLITHAANPFASPEISYFRNPLYTFTEVGLMIVFQLPIVYSMMYIVLPKLILRKKYIATICAVAGLWFLGGLLNYYSSYYIQPKILSVFLPPGFQAGPPRSEGQTFFMSVVFMMKGVLAITSNGLVIKFAKYWYLKEQRALQLQKENTESQLRLLIAQVHPHFLFNTLNNIYSKTQIESPDGSKMIMGLSDMLRYILYEGQKPLVPLKQELMMITAYIGLEKIRYGNKLDVHVLTPDKMDDIYIAPLLLLPFVENCFKHGTSNMLQNPWINLTLELKDTTLIMKLMNGKATSKENGSGKPGIGMGNVRQRLELLYKDNYELQVRGDEEVFVVDLKVKLIRIKNTTQSAMPVSATTVAYA